MEDTISDLKSLASSDPEVSIADAKFWDCRKDVFEEEDDDVVVVFRKDKMYEGGSIKHIRRVFVKNPATKEYSNVGWVVNGDVETCMLCVSSFSLFNGRHHCRICGDLSCSNCSSSEVLMSEFRSYGPVRVCDQCYYGQVGPSYKQTM